LFLLNLRHTIRDKEPVLTNLFFLKIDISDKTIIFTKINICAKIEIALLLMGFIF